MKNLMSDEFKDSINRRIEEHFAERTLHGVAKTQLKAFIIAAF